MPFINLAVAQATAAWVAAPNLVTLFIGQGPAFNYIVAAVGALIVVAGAFIGARISKTIAAPTLLSLVAALSFAIIAAAAAAALIGPSATTEVEAHLFTFLPVAAAIAGYFYTAKQASV